MSVSCPECGGDVPVSARTIPVLAGSCPSCSREVLLLSPGTQPMAAAAAPVEAESASAPSAGLTLPHPGDGDCDGTLTLEAVGNDRLVGACSDCGEEFTFKLFDPDAAEAPRRPMRERLEDAPRRSFERRGSEDGPPSRPCRQCGGALSFETGEDGTVTGHCASCGNTFSLAPRRDGPGGGRGGGGGGRYGPPRGGGGGGGRGGFRPGGYRGRPPSGGGGGFNRGGRDEGSDDRRRRRFRRDD